MENSFNKMGVAPPILKAIEEMGFSAPTEVQSQAIPHILNKEDLIVMSKTGSGKTAVFGVSMLQMIDPLAIGPQGLILTPTRELAVQIDSDIKQIGKYLPHKTTAVYGQHNINVEIQAINQGVSIISGTPGRVFDHIRHGKIVTKNIRFLVLDEADRMLDMGFLSQVVRIIKTLPKDRVTLLFSATIPTEVRRICTEYMRNPVTIEIESLTKTVDTTEQVYYRVERSEKNLQLHRILMIEQPESCIIFCNTRFAVDRVQIFLSKRGHACQILHGDVPQIKRTRTIEQFKRGDFHLLIATDVAARGIHIDELSLVINYDVPIEKDSYVHRIGRTGRIGNGGRAISLVTGEDIMGLYEIEEHIGAMIIENELPSERAFNENREAAEIWINDHKQVIIPPHAKLPIHSGIAQKQPVKPNQHASRPSSHNPKAPHHSAKPQHSESPRHNERPAHPVRQEKLEQPKARNPAPEVQPSPPPKAQSPKVPVSAKTPTLIQRLKKQLFGK